MEGALRDRTCEGDIKLYCSLRGYINQELPHSFPTSGKRYSSTTAPRIEHYGSFKNQSRMSLLVAPLTVLCLLQVSPSFAYTAPSTLSKFHPVLSRAKLQAPDSSTAAANLFGYSSSYFHLQDGTYMQFQMKGSSKRSELRERTTSGDEAAWSVESDRLLYAEIALPQPVSAMNEITFLQVHCGAAPALRVSWRKSYSQSGTTYSDCIISNLRDGLGGDDVNKKFLAQRSAATTTYQIRVRDSKVTISIGGQTVLSEASLSFWDNYDCYFKAGVYINNPSSESEYARTKFRELDWS